MFLQRYYANLFISIIQDGASCHLLAEAIKNKKSVKTFEAIFENENETFINPKAIDYIKNLTKDYKEHYISYAITSANQGAFDGLNISDTSIDENSVEIVEVDESWSIYASSIDISWAKDLFRPFDLDLLYSPFAFLNEQVKTYQNIQTTLFLYAFAESFALAIFDKEHFLYGTYFKLEKDFMTYMENSETNELIEELESLSTDDEMEVLDEEDIFLDLENNLDFETFDDKNTTSTQISQNSDINLLKRDIDMYENIISCIKEFYDFKNYSKFIDKIVIFDTALSTKAIANILKDEQFMDVEIIEVNPLKDMNNLAKRDIGL